MQDLKLLNIQRGDSQEDLSNKLNYNFQKVLELGGGAYGFSGKKGPIGDTGSKGPTGPVGLQGDRGNFWYAQLTEPVIGVTLGDYWINPDSGKIYKYSAPTGPVYWVDQYQSMSDVDPINSFEIKTGPSGSREFGYLIDSVHPEYRTLVISSATGPNVKNPLLSKVIVGNSGGINYPLVEFTKTEFINGGTANAIKNPRIKWIANSSSNYGIDFYSPDGITIDAKNVTMSAKGIYWLRAGSYNSTPIYSSDVNFTAGQDINFYSTDRSTFSGGGKIDIVTNVNPSQTEKFNVSSLNIPVWNETYINSKIRLYSDFYDGTSNDLGNITTLQGLFYNRTIAPQRGENLLRVSYKGSSSMPGNLAYDRNLFVVESDGESRFDRKISGFNGPTGSNAIWSTGQWTISGVTGPSFTVVPTIYTGATPRLQRYSLGDIFVVDKGSVLPSYTNNLLVINAASFNSTGILQNSSVLSFTVTGTTGGFNGIYLETASTPSTSITIGGTATTSTYSIFSVAPPYNGIYAESIDVTLFVRNGGYKLYWSAYGGNFISSDYPSIYTGLTSGCLYA
jgi:hypothetical protein